MYERQSERMALGKLDISVDGSLSDYQHNPCKTLRKYQNKNLPVQYEQVLLTMHALRNDRRTWTTTAC